MYAKIVSLDDHLILFALELVQIVKCEHTTNTDYKYSDGSSFKHKCLFTADFNSKTKTQTKRSYRTNLNSIGFTQ